MFYYVGVLMFVFFKWYVICLIIVCDVDVRKYVNYRIIMVICIVCII